MKAWRNPYIVSFAQAAAGFRAGAQTPRDFLERCIANVDKYENRVKAFVTLNVKGARKAADGQSRKRPSNRSGFFMVFSLLSMSADEACYSTTST